VIKLAIVDDDQRLVKTLKSELLEFDEIESVITSHSGLSFAKELEQMGLGKRPEVIVMDISMGTPDEGIRATRLIKSRFPEIEIVMFSVSDEDARIFEAFKAGAMGYLLKNETPAFILKTIIDVKNGGAQMSPGIARKAIRHFAPEQIRLANPEESGIEELSLREREVLELVAKGKTYQEVAENLFVATNTVKKHMMNIFEKLQVNNKVQAIKKTHGL
jgi:DNA-binding NarL/FixJ family response regulator